MGMPTFNVLLHSPPWTRYRWNKKISTADTFIPSHKNFCIAWTKRSLIFPPGLFYHFSLTHPTLSLNRLVFRPKERQDVIVWPFHFSKNKYFLFILKKKKERKVSAPLPDILRGRQRSVHWHFDHARKREASPIISSAGLYGAIDLHPLCISAI